MRTKMHATGYLAELYMFKDSAESVHFLDDALPGEKMMSKHKEPRNSAGSIDSPVSIFSTPLGKAPPPMKPLPAPALEKSEKKKGAGEIPTRLLPVNAKWGGARKDDVLWVSPRYQEIIEDLLDNEKLESRARLPIKATRQLAATPAGARAEKEKQRGLETKRWAKHRGAKKLAKDAAEALDLGHGEVVALDDSVPLEEEEAQPTMRRGTAVTRKEPRGKERARAHAELRAKTRRSQRLASRDAKCFAFHDPVEAAAEEKNTPPPRVLDETYWRRLLRSGATLESKKKSSKGGAAVMLEQLEDAEHPTGGLRAKPSRQDDGGVHAKTARKDKDKQRSKADKWWAKHRGRTKEHTRAHARWLEDGGAGVLGDVWAGEREPLRDNPCGKERARAHAELRAKTRRSQRLASRDAKCFAFDDAENVGWAVEAPQAKEEAGRSKAKAVCHAVCWKSLKSCGPFQQTGAYQLLCKEAEGPALSDVFLCGLVLSMAAARDLKDMISAQQAAAALEERLEKAAAKAKGAANPNGAASPNEKKKKKALLAPAKEKGRGAAAAMRKPSAVKSFAGKRRC